MFNETDLFLITFITEGMKYLLATVFHCTLIKKYSPHFSLVISALRQLQWFTQCLISVHSHIRWELILLCSGCILYVCLM